MKIGFIQASAGTISGGMETFVYQMGLALSARHKTILFTGKGSKEKLLPHIENGPFEVYTAGFISRKLRFNKAISKIFWLLFRIYIRNFDVESFSLYLAMLLKPRVRQILKSCDVLVTVYFRDSILFSRHFSKRGVPFVFYIPGDVHLKRFFKIDKSAMYLCISNARKDVIEKRDDIKIDGVVTPGIPKDYLHLGYINADSPPSLLFVGRLVKYKGLDELLWIFATLKEEFSNLRLTLVGDGSERSRLERIIAQKGIFRDVHITGQIPQTEIHSYYRNSTVLVHPSDIESFCIVVLEAMAFGLPVVATDLPAIREASNGEVFLLSKSDLNSWVKKIRFLLNNPVKRRELSKRIQGVASRHTWDIKSREFEDYLSSAISKNIH